MTIRPIIPSFVHFRAIRRVLPLRANGIDPAQLAVGAQNPGGEFCASTEFAGNLSISGVSIVVRIVPKWSLSTARRGQNSALSTIPNFHKPVPLPEIGISAHIRKVNFVHENRISNESDKTIRGEKKWTSRAGGATIGKNALVDSFQPQPVERHQLLTCYLLRFHANGCVSRWQFERANGA